MTYWVSMTDSFLSGWGGAKGRISKLVIECETGQEAEIVAENASDRTDMKYINICYKRPYYHPDRYQVEYHDKTDYPTWFRLDRPFLKSVKDKW